MNEWSSLVVNFYDQDVTTKVQGTDSSVFTNGYRHNSCGTQSSDALIFRQFLAFDVELNVWKANMCNNMILMKKSGATSVYECGVMEWCHKCQKLL